VLRIISAVEHGHGPVEKKKAEAWMRRSLSSSSCCRATTRPSPRPPAAGADGCFSIDRLDLAGSAAVRWRLWVRLGWISRSRVFAFSVPPLGSWHTLLRYAGSYRVRPLAVGGSSSQQVMRPRRERLNAAGTLNRTACSRAWASLQLQPHVMGLDITRAIIFFCLRCPRAF
jgi:hypothetical protein